MPLEVLSVVSCPSPHAHTGSIESSFPQLLSRARGLGTNAACWQKAVFHGDKYAALHKQIRKQTQTLRSGEQIGKITHL